MDVTANLDTTLDTLIPALEKLDSKTLCTIIDRLENVLAKSKNILDNTFSEQTATVTDDDSDTNVDSDNFKKLSDHHFNFLGEDFYDKVFAHLKTLNFQPADKPNTP